MCGFRIYSNKAGVLWNLSLASLGENASDLASDVSPAGWASWPWPSVYEISPFPISQENDWQAPPWDCKRCAVRRDNWLQVQNSFALAGANSAEDLLRNDSVPSHLVWLKHQSENSILLGPCHAREMRNPLKMMHCSTGASEKLLLSVNHWNQYTEILVKYNYFYKNSVLLQFIKILFFMWLFKQ